MNGNAYLHMTDSQETMNDLISRYHDMERQVLAFSNVVDSYRDLLEDQIMDSADQALQAIKEDLQKINKYISDFTGEKLASVIAIQNIEKSSVRRLGGKL